MFFSFFSSNGQISFFVLVLFITWTISAQTFYNVRMHNWARRFHPYALRCFSKSARATFAPSEY